jgi:hypothetical protein
MFFFDELVSAPRWVIELGRLRISIGQFAPGKKT